MPILSIPNFNGIFSNCCPCLEKNEAVEVKKSASPQVIREKMGDWLTRYQTEHAKIVGLTQNGLYSLIEKEIEVISALSEEGMSLEGLVVGEEMRSVQQTIQNVVRPRLDNLRTDLEAARAKMSTVSEEKLSYDKRLEEKWERLQFPSSVLETHADCARFLIDSELAFKIAGYRETCGDRNRHDIRLDPDGHPTIKVQGDWVRWETLNQQLIYDEPSLQIKSRHYPGSVVQGWSYLDEGLVPIDRFNNEKLVPIYRLTPEEYQAVRAQALKFYETNPEHDLGVEKDCIVQISTSPREEPKNPLYKNLNRNLNDHVAVRIIKPNGDVYSTGLYPPGESQKFLEENFLGTVNANLLKTGDYEEFRPHHGRIVTCVPLTSLRADRIVKTLEEIKDYRLQFQRQNCSNVGRLVMKEAGYEIDNRTSSAAVLLDALPDGKDLPFIGPVIGLIQKCTQPIFSGLSYLTPNIIKTISSYAIAVITYIPCKLTNIFLNLVTLKFGGGKMLQPLAEGVEEDEFYDNRQVINFSRVIRSWSDLFRDETNMVYHSKYIIDWQKEQRSTFIAPYTGRPKLNIVPPMEAAFA